MVKSTISQTPTRDFEQEVLLWIGRETGARQLRRLYVLV